MRFGVVGIIAVAFLALEIVGIYLVANRIGGLETAMWLVLDMILGGMVIRRAGAGFLPRLQQALHQGQAPFALLWATGRRFLAGALLVFPGALSDGIALLLLLWPSARPSPAPRAPREDGVIEGEFRRED